MPLEVDFDQAVHDFDNGRVNVYASDNGDRVYCGITDEALQDISGSSTIEPGELAEIARTYALELRPILESKYAAGVRESDGYFVVKSMDVA